MVEHTLAMLHAKFGLEHAAQDKRRWGSHRETGCDLMRMPDTQWYNIWLRKKLRSAAGYLLCNTVERSIRVEIL